MPTFRREEPAIALPAAVVGGATLSKMALKGDPDGYRLAYESGMGAVEAQATVLREVRDRAGSALSVAIAAAGFAVGLALTVDPPSRMGTIGLLGAGTAAFGPFRCRSGSCPDLAPQRGALSSRCRPHRRFIC